MATVSRIFSAALEELKQQCTSLIWSEKQSEIFESQAADNTKYGKYKKYTRKSTIPWPMATRN